jgi:hypothetical protein
MKESDAKYRAKNREKILAYQKEWRVKNAVRVAAQKKAWYEENKAKVLAGQKVKRDSDPEKYRAVKRAGYAKNPAKHIANARNREMGLKHRTPGWANFSFIEEIYRDAAEFRAAGLDVHVDHTIPLRAKLVSGLHVHNNLTIKLASWNDSKGNRVDGLRVDDML